MASVPALKTGYHGISLHPLFWGVFSSHRYRYGYARDERAQPQRPGARGGGLSPLPGAQCESNLGLVLVHYSVFSDVKKKTARPSSPSEEYQDKLLSVDHEAQKDADIGGIILLDEQADNVSVCS